MEVAVLIPSGIKHPFGDSVRIRKVLETLKKECKTHIINLETLYRTLGFLQRARESVYALLKYVIRHECSMYLNDMRQQLLSERLERMLSKINPSLLIAEGSFSGFVASELKIDIPIILDLHGLASYEQLVEGHINNWQFKVLKRKEKEMYQLFDYLSVVSLPMKQYLISEGVSPEKIILARNGGENRVEAAKYRKPLTLIYAGSFARWEKISDFIKIKEYINPEIFQLVLIGGGRPQNIKKNVIRDAQNRKIPYLGEMPRKDVFGILQKAQVGVVPSTNDIVRVVSCPIKVWDYLSVGLPIITPKIGEWSEIIEANHCGVVTKNSDPVQFAEASKIFLDKKIWLETSYSAKRLIREKMSWEKTLEKLREKILEYAH